MLPSCLDRTNSHLKRISVSKREKEGRRHDERGKEGENYGQVGPSNVTMSETDRRQRKILVFSPRSEGDDDAVTWLESTATAALAK